MITRKYYLTSLVLAIILSLSSCSSKAPQMESDENFIEYAIDVTGGFYTPKQASFLMTMEEVLQIKGLTQSEVEIDYGTGNNNDRILVTMTHPSLPDASYLKEVFTFEKKLDTKHLIRVEYFIFVDTELAHSLCDELYNQAKEHLGTPENDDPDFYLKRHSVRWEDEQGEQGNRIDLFLTDNRNQAPAFDGKTCILLSLYISRDTFDNFFSETP